MTFIFFALSLCVMGAGWHEKLRTGTHKNKFRTYTEYMTLVEEMLTTYPRYLRKEAIGKSVEGRELFVLNLQDHDSNLPKDKIFIGALTHAREAITCLAALDYVARTLEAIKNKDPEAVYVSQRRLVVVQPFINPDSYVANEKDPQAMIRKNRAKVCTDWLQGVDLNRNFPMYSPATIANKQKCSETYSSTEPFDQPETQAIKTVFDKHKFTVGLSLHAHGRMLIIPGNLKPAERKFFDECREPAKVKLYGTDMETVKYKAPGAMSTWFWEGHKTYGMCFEIGDAFWPTHGAKARLLKGTYSFIRFLVLKSGCQPRVDESGGNMKVINDGAGRCRQLSIVSFDKAINVGNIESRESSEVTAAVGACVKEKGVTSCLCGAEKVGGGKWVGKEDPRCAILIASNPTSNPPWVFIFVGVFSVSAIVFCLGVCICIFVFKKLKSTGDGVNAEKARRITLEKEPTPPKEHGRLSEQEPTPPKLRDLPEQEPILPKTERTSSTTRIGQLKKRDSRTRPQTIPQTGQTRRECRALNRERSAKPKVLPGKPKFDVSRTKIVLRDL